MRILIKIEPRFKLENSESNWSELTYHGRLNVGVFT